MNELKNDINLREAVSRREQQQAPMPADLNERLMERLSSVPSQERANQARFRSLSLWRGRGVRLLIAVAASIALLVVFYHGEEQTPQEPMRAQTIEQPKESVVAQQTDQQVAVVSDTPQSSDTPTPKKPKKVVMKLVELIPDSEAEPELTAEVEPVAEEEDPFIAMADQIEDIRQRGLRLQQEIDKHIEN